MPTIDISAARHQDQDRQIYQFITDNGLRNGSIHMNVDGSTEPKQFWIQPLDSDQLLLDRVIVTVASSTALGAGRYGSLPALLNGINVVVATGGNLDETHIVLTEQHPIRTNADWAEYGGIGQEITFGGGTNYWVIDIPFVSPFILHPGHTDAFGVIINDDLSALAEHHMFVRGWKQSPQG